MAFRRFRVEGRRFPVSAGQDFGFYKGSIALERFRKVLYVGAWASSIKGLCATQGVVFFLQGLRSSGLGVQAFLGFKFVWGLRKRAAPVKTPNTKRKP